MGFRAVPFMLMDCLPFSSSTFAKNGGLSMGNVSYKEEDRSVFHSQASGETREDDVSFGAN